MTLDFMMNQMNNHWPDTHPAYPYILSWEELCKERQGGAGGSGVGGEDEDLLSFLFICVLSVLTQFDFCLFYFVRLFGLVVLKLIVIRGKVGTCNLMFVFLLLYNFCF